MKEPPEKTALLSAAFVGASPFAAQGGVVLAAGGALAVLTALTVAVGYLSLPIVPAVILGLSIATVKGGLVAGYFMHLLSEKQVIYVVLAFTVVFFVAMLILMYSSIVVHRSGVP